MDRAKNELKCSPGEHYDVALVKDKKLSDYFARMAKKAAKARLEKISPSERQRIARKAARVRWAQRKGKT